MTTKPGMMATVHIITSNLGNVVLQDEERN